MTRRGVGTALAGLLTAVPIAFWLMAVWTARTFSYSEKMANTGLILLFGIPAMVGVSALAYYGLSLASEDSSL